ncbi:hypothetical protein LN042_22470 [Kitasatospora sp. RB6PN24]|uniref:hypothetical protein n=1 Tax=Kitasatospora humi TaxID=2893891 RepID=UPI001E30977E|nr:hypothetical protein [Kitasatospora humi]MCC9309803.1 hypothetical protein [Kitasatospora humi]
MSSTPGSKAGRRTRVRPAPRYRFHRRARLHGTVADGVPRWAVRAAYATTLTTLPSCLWRLALLGHGDPLLEPSTTPPPGHGPVLVTGAWYVVALSVVSEALAFLTVGLVSTWGETVPRWIPLLRGRRVPVPAATVPAAVGSLLLMVFPYGLLMFATGRMVNSTRQTPGTGLVTHGWQTVAFYAAYVPLAAWGPLVAVLTVHYHRRRTAALRRRPGLPAPAG